MPHLALLAYAHYCLDGCLSDSACENETSLEGETGRRMQRWSREKSFLCSVQTSPHTSFHVCATVTFSLHAHATVPVCPCTCHSALCLPTQAQDLDLCHFLELAQKSWGCSNEDQMLTLCFSLCTEDNNGTMDLFGGADDISSGSDGEDKPPTPGQPVVSKSSMS